MGLTTTWAPVAVVPGTTVDPVNVWFGVGAVIVTGTVAGGACRTYRFAVMSGRSVIRPAARSMIRRTSWAWAQVSGAAEPAGWPSANPLEAVVGSVPKGSAGTSGSSQACSGTSPTPDADRSRNDSWVPASAVSPCASAVSARSPDSTGQ